jgi:hypothetical protein
MDDVLYVVVCWPESQELMEHPEFNTRCYLINDDKGIEDFGSSAYFVPVDMINTESINSTEL